MSKVLRWPSTSKEEEVEFWLNKVEYARRGHCVRCNAAPVWPEPRGCSSHDWPWYEWNGYCKAPKWAQAEHLLYVARSMVGHD
jgi:hypothetical protein